MPKRIPGKWRDGELDCGSCANYEFELVINECTAIGEGDEWCIKERKEFLEGKNCRHWKSSTPLLPAPPQACT